MKQIATKKIAAARLKRALLFLLAVAVITAVFSFVGCNRSKNKQTEIFRDLSDFEYKNVAITTGSLANLDIDKKISHVHYKNYNDMAGQIEALRKGDVDAIGLDKPVAVYVAADKDDLSVFPKTVVDTDYGFMFKKDSGKAKIFSDIIRDFKKDGTVDALEAKWFSADTKRMVIDWDRYVKADRKGGELRFAVDPSSIPLAYMGNDGKPAGYEIELLLMIADKLDKNVVFEITTVDSLIHFVDTGIVDVAGGAIAMTAEREAKIDYSDAHYSGGIVLLCRKENIVEGDGDILLNSQFVELAIDNDSPYYEQMKAKYPLAKFILVSNDDAGYEAVRKGEVAGYVTGENALRYRIRGGMDDIRAHSDRTDFGAVVAIYNDTEEEMTFLERIGNSFYRNFIKEDRWKLIGRGLFVTLEIAASACVIGTVLGFFIMLTLRSKRKWLSKTMGLVGTLLSGIPGVVILMFFYFVIFDDVGWDPVFVAILAFSLSFSFRVGEVMANGINSVDVGQWEAAEALGFSRIRTFGKVIMPQAMGQILPLYKSEFVSMVETTSVVGYIAIQDLTKASDLIRSMTYEAFLPLIVTALIYFAISHTITSLLGRMEVKMNPDKSLRKFPHGVKPGKIPAYIPFPKVEQTDKPLIEIEHIEKKYDDTSPLIDVNATVKKGEVITVIGPSGTGKSTLLRCINRLEVPTGGCIRVFGKDVNDKKTNLSALRRRMGMVFQNFNLFHHLTVIENIMLAPVTLNKVSKQEAYETGMYLLRSVGMAEKALNYPEELSGGQKQRVAIARALAMRPEIMLFDEPTSALDPTMVGEVLSVMKKLAKEGMTMLIVTHEMRFAKDVSTEIFYMDEGIIYDKGTPEEIFENPEKPKTRIFVNRLQALTFTITSPNYDFIAMTESFASFGEKHFMTRRQIEGMQRAFEEICALNIIPNSADDYTLTVSTEYDGVSKLAMYFTWGGKPYSPLDEGDDLSVRLIKAYLKTYTYSYENGENRLTVTM